MRRAGSSNVARVLLLYPNRWGRGITALWIASHTAALRHAGHEVELFDCTFFADWAQHEVAFNTANRQYAPTEYDRLIRFDATPVREALAAKLRGFDPDIVFWSALSSHIHGEGEYVSIQHGYELMSAIPDTRAQLVAGGLQTTAAPADTFARFPRMSLLIAGESERVLCEVADGKPPATIRGVIHRDDAGVHVNERQPLITDMDAIGPADYSLFDDQVFLRPYNGKVVRGCDYELSRGCIFACSYCVETVIQRYYGFVDQTRRGAILNPRGYLRNKSAGRVMEELTWLRRERSVTLFRCQDTNFLTIDRAMLLELAGRMDAAALDLQLYIETRPEGINASTIPLLKRLRVDGVGMGIELSTQSFREKSLNRYADQAKIVDAFRLLREAGIRRTAYNIIGLPDQDESSILDTIDLNRRLDPDNITVAFYSPFQGTAEQVKGHERAYFDDYELDVDAQLRSVSKHTKINRELLGHYKQNFVRLVREGTAA